MALGFLLIVLGVEFGGEMEWLTVEFDVAVIFEQRPLFL